MADCADCSSDHDKPRTLRIFELQHLTRVQDSESDPTCTRVSKSLSDILVYHDVEGPLTAISHSGSTNSTVYRGALLTEKQGQGPSPRVRELSRVILKMGFGDNAIQRLLHEYKCYKSLVPLQGEQIPLFHGLYHGYMAGSERTAAACLLLEDCGDPCAQADNPALTEMPWRFRKSVVQCVELLHKTYGVEHKKLIISWDKKILVRRIGNERKPCIVGFGQATVNEHKCPVNMCVADQPWRIASRRSVHNKCPELLEIALIVDLWIPTTFVSYDIGHNADTWDFATEPVETFIRENNIHAGHRYDIDDPESKQYALEIYHRNREPLTLLLARYDFEERVETEAIQPIDHWLLPHEAGGISFVDSKKDEDAATVH